MSKRQKAVWYFAVIFSMVLFLSESVMSQLVQEWYVETPGNESHQFRGVGVAKAAKLKYISDTETDVVYIYSDDNPNEPIDSFGNPSWIGKWGPYGIGVANDQMIYIAVWDEDDENGDGLPDYALWRCAPWGNHLTRVCYLPYQPRGLKVIGQGANTVVYIASHTSHVMRCTQIKANHFQAEVLFNTGIGGQQNVLPNRSENILYVSAWNPYYSKVTKWDYNWDMDPFFSVDVPVPSNVPGFALDRSESSLYIFHLDIDQGYIHKVDATTGTEEYSVAVGPSDVSAWAGDININAQGTIYFARSWDRGDGTWGSAWGKVIDSRLSKEMVDNDNAPPEPTIVSEYKLFQNSPNPFNPTTKINYSIAKDSHVKLMVYNTLGQIVAVLVDGFQPKGSHSGKWDAYNQPSGLYIYRLEADGFTATKKMFLQK